MINQKYRILWTASVLIALSISACYSLISPDNTYALLKTIQVFIIVETCTLIVVLIEKNKDKEVKNENLKS